MRTTADVLTDIEHVQATEATVIADFKERHRARVAQLQAELEEIRTRVSFSVTLDRLAGSYKAVLVIGDVTHTQWGQSEAKLHDWKTAMVKKAFPSEAELTEAIPEPTPEPETAAPAVIEPTSVVEPPRLIDTDQTPTIETLPATPAAAFDPVRQETPTASLPKPPLPPFEVPFNERDTPRPVPVAPPPKQSLTGLPKPRTKKGR